MATELENLVPEADVEVEGMRGPKGDKGDSYVLTEADKEEIARKVDTIIDAETDKSLTISGKPADAKAAGDEINNLKADLSEMATATAEDVGKALLVKTVENGEVTEWEFGEAGESLDDVLNSEGHTFVVHDNLLEGFVLTPKKTINNSTGDYETLNIDWASAFEEYIPVEAGKIYKLAKVVSGNVSAQSIYRGAYYTSDKTYVSGHTGGGEFTIPSNVSYMRIAIDNRQATEFIFGLKDNVVIHINQNNPRFYNVTLVDKTLTESNKAADAKVTGDKINAIDEFNDKFVVHDNLLESLSPTVGYYIDHTNGAAVSGANTLSCFEDYIPVDELTKYRLAGVSSGTLSRLAMHRFAFYASDKTFISGGVTSSSATSPANAAYIRFSYDNRNATELLFNMDEIVTEHITKNAMVFYHVSSTKFKTVEANSVSSDIYIPRTVKDSLITDDRLLTSILKPGSLNLIDRTQLIPKKHIENDGTIIDTNGSTGIIYCYKITPETEYSATVGGYMFNQGWWLDENGNNLSKSAFSTSVSTATSPAGAYGIVMEVNYTNESYLTKSLMLVEGDTLPSSFVQYSNQYKVKPEYLPGAKGNKDWSQYYWVAMGDSRTAGYSHNLIDETTGEKIWDEGENEANYVQIIADKTGINVDNRSWSGAAFAYREGVDTYGGYTQSENLPAYTDIVTVFLGTNDCFNGLYEPHGGITFYGERDNQNDPYDVTTYMGAIRQLIKNIKLQCPLARILFISDNRLDVSGVPAYDGGKNKIDCLKEICAGYKIPILNLEECAQTGKAGDSYLERKWRPYTDGLHESVVGHKFTAYAVAGEMAKYLW